MDDLILQIKELIIECLNLEDVSPEDIDPDAPLFGDGLGLDSIDALELVLGLERKFQIKVPSGDETRKLFASVSTLAQLVRSCRP